MLLRLLLAPVALASALASASSQPPSSPAGDWIATVASYSAAVPLLAGVDVDAQCAKKPLWRCPLAVYFNLSAVSAAPTCWRVNSDLSRKEIVPGEFASLPATPWSVEVMRRGSYFFLKVNGVQTHFVRSPRFEIHCDGNDGGGRPANVEPVVSGAAFQMPNGTAIPFRLFPFSWGTMLDAPVITHGRERWSASQAIPGAVLREHGTTYLYFVASAQDMPKQESGGNVVGGVAHCAAGQEASPSAWTYLPNPILHNESGTPYDSVSVFINGVVKTPDGRYCLSFFGEPIMRIGFAFSDSPLGPFIQDDSYTIGVSEGGKGNGTFASGFPPWASLAQHEHDLIRLDNGTYVLFYTGFGGFYKSKAMPHPSIDQGGIATSEDLKHWRFIQQPVLRHRYDEKSGCDPLRDDCHPNVAQFWDGAFVRPRSLNKIGRWWYCLYEGANGYPRPGTQPGASSEHITGCDAITDSIGIARARDILGPWDMSFPLHLAVPQPPGDRFDSVWVGWPRMIKHNMTHMYVFYAAGGLNFWTNGTNHIADTGIMLVSIDELVNFGT